jgi:tight adherence protein C
VRFALLGGLALWGAVTLALSELRWFARRSLVDRLRPYAPGVPTQAPRSGLLSVESFRDIIGPLSRTIGERLARLFGVSEELATRLERIHSPYDVTAFRTRQIGTSVIALALASIAAGLVRPLAPVAVLIVLGAPLLAFLVLEQRVSARSAAWQRRVFLELPVISEQLAMLLAAGYSVGAALNRLARRGHGACADDLGRVMGRVQQGLTEVDACREWAALARVQALDRLVAVIALNHEAADLGRLISEEARSIRRDVQRSLVETMERRSQQVWVPVTVATLVPGVIFLSIPFIEALRLFSAS